jgi:hypothetical protein
VSSIAQLVGQMMGRVESGKSGAEDDDASHEVLGMKAMSRYPACVARDRSR